MRLFCEPIGSWIATAITNDPDARPALDAAQCVSDDHAARRKRGPPFSSQAGPVRPGMNRMRSAANSPPSVTTLFLSKRSSLWSRCVGFPLFRKTSNALERSFQS